MNKTVNNIVKCKFKHGVDVNNEIMKEMSLKIEMKSI